MDFSDLDTSLKVTLPNVTLYANWLFNNQNEIVQSTNRSNYITSRIGFVESNRGAIISFLKKTGLVTATLEVSPLAKLVAKEDLLYRELCLIHLSKQSLFLQGEPKVNLITLLSTYLQDKEKTSIDLREIRNYDLSFQEIEGNRNSNNRTDYILTLLKGTDLFAPKGRVEDGVLALSPKAKSIINYFAERPIPNCEKSLNSAERFDYFCSLDGGVFDILSDQLPVAWMELFPHLTLNNLSKIKNTLLSTNMSNSNNCLQQIFYGAPGTGKSHKISDDKDVKVAATKDLVFRTTFHPDTDYATFVGCYKPRTHKKSMIDGNGINETQLLSCFFDSNSPKYKSKNKARYLYEALVHTKDIRDLGLDAQAIADKLNAKKFSGCAYTTEATCMYNIYDWLKEDGYIVENKLSYEFAPQCFVKAYIEAWKHQQSGDPVFLIIEEINRGNCAQIFGDLFQLLDRDNNGFSRYEISPDSDLQEYISGIGLDITNITDTDGNDISAKIASGELMKLPNNLYIWATMNTSDQSLFPIDSAFKRRWEWKYIKITKPKDKNWELEDGTKWWDFLQMINAIIASMTSSADKQLGYFFCKPDKDNNTISYERFVNKVVFYLWNDVFKDYALDEGQLFKFTPQDEEKKDLEERDLTYPDFYDDITGKEQNYVVKQFIDHVMNWKKEEKKV